MAAINEAWRVLGNRTLRAEYDRWLGRDREAPPPQSAPPDRPAPVAHDEPEESTEPISYSAGWTRRWALGVGILTAVAFGFFALLVWIAMGGFD